ncbi:MAG TPA: lipoyl synthase [Acidimicrobiales bacterium]|nr:lipoyl synthase [Acidimicrobiales bacterium]
MFRVRWLGRVPYAEALALQRAVHDRSGDDYLLVLEHPHVFTLGAHADRAHVLVDPAVVGADLVETDRGGDVTYHGPGQLVAYPVVTVPTAPRSIPCHVHAIEQVVIDALADLGLPAGRLGAYPGVWVDVDSEAPRKICAIGVRVARGRSMHGLALNVDPDMTWFERIVPCGIEDKGVTSLAAEGLAMPMRAVVDRIVHHAAARWSSDGTYERQDAAWPARPPGTAPLVRAGDAPASDRPPDDTAGPRGAPASPEGGAPRHGDRGARHRGPGQRLRIRLRQAGVEPGAGLDAHARKPPWLRVPARMGPAFLDLRRTVRDLGLVTVCEEAGCPNIYECWADGTATFMINGERCTRACGFCLVDTRHPLPLDDDEPERVAAAVERLGLAHAVVTAVARDDLPDGGAGAFVATIAAVRRRCPGTAVEVLVPDCKGAPDALAAVFDARPDVLNHNVETVARLQRAVRPSAGYARSLAVLARAKDAGLVTKSGMILGMGERFDEVVATLADMRAVGVDIVTLGQYLRPTAAHLPVARWWTPEEFDAVRSAAQGMGFAHVEASPLTRSSYHARQAATATGSAPPGDPLRLGVDG